MNEKPKLQERRRGSTRPKTISMDGFGEGDMDGKKSRWLSKADYPSIDTEFIDGQIKIMQN